MVQECLVYSLFTPCCALHPALLTCLLVALQILSYLEECGGIYEEGVLRICGETNRMKVIRSTSKYLPDNKIYAYGITKTCTEYFLELHSYKI